MSRAIAAVRAGVRTAVVAAVGGAATAVIATTIAVAPDATPLPGTALTAAASDPWD